jgi:hypothetical protein
MFRDCRTTRARAQVSVTAAISTARKFKTCQTSLGFFDQAITAPSTKAALEVAPDPGPYAFPVKFH